MSELKALLVSERVFGLEDQRSGQACCYRNFPFLPFFYHFFYHFDNFAATGTFQSTMRKPSTTSSSCLTATYTLRYLSEKLL